MKLTIGETVYDFDVDSITNREAMLLEDQLGLTFQEFTELLQRGSMKALTGLAWLAMRRTDPEAPFDAVDFKLADIEDEAPLAEGAGNSATDTASLSLASSE